MFEITYNDADALEHYEEEKRAYPGAKYDFTFEKRFLVYHADMLHQIIYYAIDMKTGLSSEVMRRKSGSPVKKAEYASVMSAINESYKARFEGKVKGRIAVGNYSYSFEISGFNEYRITGRRYLK